MADTNSQQSKNRKLVRFVVFNGIIAALYVLLTYLLAPISYGSVQARVAEVMTIFPIFSAKMIIPPILVYGLIVGGYLPF